MEPITIAILAKDKAHTLPFFLHCIHNQTFPKQHIHLYIRTNDNTDETAIILQEFIETNGKEYKSVYFDQSSVSEKLKQWPQHKWNKERFKILGKIRQESIEYAKQIDSHYFVIDCDNFITSETLQTMYNSREKGVLGPMLQSTSLYSNFHYVVNPQGYHISGNPMYMKLYKRKICGIYPVKVIHCTYFINKDRLNNVLYNDGSGRHEYVIFSDNLRKNNIEQYLDNREQYGFLTMAVTKEQFANEIQKHWSELLRTKFKGASPP